MPEITQRVYTRMTTEVSYTEPDFFGEHPTVRYTTTEPISVPAGTVFYFVPARTGYKELVFEQDMELVMSQEGETDGPDVTED